MRLLELQLDLYETKTNGLSTEDGSVKALLQILYSHLILGAFGFFCRKKNQLHFPMDKGLTHSAKIVLIVWPKIPQMPQKISAQFVCPSSKVSDFWKKKLSLGVRSTTHFKLSHLNLN